MRRLAGFLVLAMVLVPGPGRAQTSAPTPLLEGADVRIIDGREQVAPRAVDDSTLRYHASRGDKAAVEAEIERLRREYPGWQPPGDLYATAPGVDEEPLWNLYKKGDYPALRAEIGRLQAVNPDWRPPALLLDLTETNEVRGALQASEAAKDWAGIVAEATGHPAQISCGRIDNMWRLAEAHARLQQPAEAQDVYRRIIGDCGDVAQRVATLQKAQALLGQPQTRELFALEETRPKSAAEAARIASLEQTAAARVAPTRQAPAQPPELRALYAPDADVKAAAAAERVALGRKDAAAARKIGWIYFAAKDNAAAADWFARAYGWKAEEETARGLALSRAELGDLPGVEQLAAAWPALVGPILETARGRVVAQAFERQDHAIVLAGTQATELPELMLLRSWTFMQLERPTEAGMSFERVVRRSAASDAQREEGLYGLARANIAMGDFAAAARISDGYGLNLAHRQELRGDVLRQEASQAFDAGRYRQALAILEERRGIVMPDRAALIQEAWANYHINRARSAERIFADLHRVLATKETAEGLRVVRAKINGFDS